MADDVERLRADAVRCFQGLGPPPVYLRVDETVKARLAGQREVVLALKARALALDGGAMLVPALDEGLAVLDAAGRGAWVEAEEAWHRLLQHQKLALKARRAFSRPDEERPPVWDAAQAQSRFDAREAKGPEVRLPCPWPRCRQEHRHALPAGVAMHGITCPKCGRRFDAFVGVLREAEVQQSSLGRDYRFRVADGLGGGVRVEVKDHGAAELQAAPGDVLAFLYTDGSTLQAVVDLSSSRVLWISRGGPCFLATAVFGEGAPQLEAFRAFRDRRLLPSAPGRLLVRGYYALGPTLARVVLASPHLTKALRGTLVAVHGVLER
ncbi:MAG: hypothetical protein K1X89_23815 [Myxococcaceae bacterium]|nr:hypothetical protein [Myxococcaceae bacterium]